jgi:anti-anti-sigma factor
VIEYRVVERAGDFVLLEVRGELAGQLWTTILQEALEDHYVDDGVKRIRLDLAPVSFMDNYGVATLVALHRESRKRGKSLLIERPQAQVRDKLAVTGVLKILQGGD